MMQLHPLAAADAAARWAAARLAIGEAVPPARGRAIPASARAQLQAVLAQVNDRLRVRLGLAAALRKWLEAVALLLRAVSDSRHRQNHPGAIRVYEQLWVMVPARQHDPHESEGPCGCCSHGMDHLAVGYEQTATP